MKKLIIPNSITLLNLLSGTLSIFFALKFPEKLYISGFLILLSSIFDFFDGFSARLLNAQSEFGKQLDSLSDLISFGLAPSFIMFSLLQSHTKSTLIPFIALIIVAFSAVRLAIFNITNQKTEFKGLATPAFAILVASIAISSFYPKTLIHINIINILNNLIPLLFITVIFSILLVTNIKMFSLKFKTYSFSQNKIRYIFILSSIFLIIILFWSAIPYIIVLYILISLSNNMSKK